MKLKGLNCFVMLLTIVLFSYGAAQAQVVDTVKDAAKKTVDVTTDAVDKAADVTVDAAKKTVDVTTDVYDKADDAAAKAAKKTVKATKNTYDKADDLAADAAEGTAKVYDKSDDVAADIWEATAKGTKHAVYYVGDKTADFAKLGYDAGKQVVQTTWDGTKWVSNKVWVFTKKAADKTVDAVQ